MTALVVSLEWRIAMRRRRVLLLNIAVPLALVVPVTLSDAPPAHAAAVFTVLFVLFGTFGAAIPLVRDAEAGLLERLALTGISPRRVLLERTAAHTALDTLQLLPALAVIVLAAPPHARTTLALVLPALLAASLLAANALGTLVAAAARSIAEAALFAAVAALFALHAAGTFRSPAPGSVAAGLEGLLPFHHLHQGLRAAAGAPGTPLDGWAVPAAMASALVGALALAALAGPVLSRLAKPTAG